MLSCRLTRTLTAVLFASALPAAHAAVVYNENTLGAQDLSSDHDNPTALSFGIGDNDIIGTVGGTERDYFSFVIAPGRALSQVTLLDAAVGGSFSFIGMENSGKITVSPTAFSTAGLIGWTHYAATDIGHDLLPAIGQGSGTPGFTPPLGPGTYSVWVQEAAPGAHAYGLRFSVTGPVPEPSTWALLAGGLGLLGWATRRRRS